MPKNLLQTTQESDFFCGSCQRNKRGYKNFQSLYHQQHFYIYHNKKAPQGSSNNIS